MKSVAMFSCTIAEVRVTPVDNFIEDREPHPFKVEILPFSILLPAEVVTVNEPYYFLAAAEGLERYKKKHRLDASEAWTFNN